MRKRVRCFLVPHCGAKADFVISVTHLNLVQISNKYKKEAVKESANKIQSLEGTSSYLLPQYVDHPSFFLSTDLTPQQHCVRDCGSYRKTQAHEVLEAIRT